ncbi:glycosyltransferase [Lentibacillus sediminis]|uniref:glycosyltransferase n=1 Tax=Lentibacillus sediminis TaxID=1940529 RepID=UPI000C1C4A6E|nr:glycosyltransferase [Lentibacillus sediminis]
MKKKKLLFVIDSLDVAGAEKSLVSLLNLLDFNRYDVDLQLFAYGHTLEELVPKEVNLLKPFNYTNFTKLNVKSALLHAVSNSQLHMLTSRVKYSLRIRKGYCNNSKKARVYWESVSNVIEKNPVEYDVAISYAQGVPTFYVGEKIKANKKIAWINVSYRLDVEEKKFQKLFYDQYDKIIAVSHSAKNVFLETFPVYKDKMDIQYDINNPQLISEMAETGKGYEDFFDGIRILTIGRLAHQKGYDTALEACKRLRDEGVHFKWYVLGKGPLKAEIEKSIREMDLAEHFILLGVEANPYPFIKKADVYVQTSRYEGFGLAIAEARMLNVPVVTSEFDAVYNQMTDGKNGLVVQRDAKAIAEGIKRIINDKELNSSIIAYLTNEKKGNVEEIERFYQLIE